VAGFIAVALVAGGSIVLGAPASAAPATVTGGSLSWGVAADYRAVFATRGQAGGATLNTATDTFSFPATTSSTYDPSTKTGTLNFTGNARIGYFAGPPVPGATAGNYFYIANPVVTLNGSTGTLSGTTAGDSHSLNPELPTAALASRVVANLDLSGVVPAINPEGTTITLGSVPATITAAGATALAFYNTAGDAAATKRAAGSALDPLTIQLNVVALPAPAAATTVALTAPASVVTGAAATLTATVTPSAAAGSVEFFDGATSLASAPVASGTASKSVTFSAPGAHSITAKFTPTDSAAFTASTSAASTVTVTTAPVVTTPTVTVSKSTVVDAGEIVTVTGAGFSPVGTATNGTRAPLSGKFGGVYVSFGKFASVWKPSSGAPLSSRPVGPGGKWVVDAADVATVGAAAGVAINADGSFSAQLLVKPGYTGEIANGNYGVYTYPGSGAAYAAFETYTPITFVATPKITVSKTTLTSAGETVTVTGSGFSPVAPATNAPRPPLAGKFGGVYVAFGKFADVWKVSEGATSSARKTDGSTLKWVVDPADLAKVGGAAGGGVAINADGTFSITMLVKPGFAGEPATGNYGVYTYPGGGSTYAAFETYTPIAFSTAPTVTVSKSVNVSPLGETVTVSGSGFAPNAPATTAARPPLAGKFGGVYVSFGKFATVWKPSTGATSASRVAAPGVKWVVDAADTATIGGAPAGAVVINADGTFTTELLLKPGYDREPASGNYGVYTYPGGGVAYPAFETYTPVVFAGATATNTSLAAAPAAVSVGGSTTLTAQVTPSTAAGSVTFALGSTTLGTVALSGGSASMPVNNLAAGVQQFTATFVPANVLNFAGSAATASVTVAEKSVGAGSLSWGIKQSFRDYVSGPIAKGAITTSGVGASGGIFTFGQSAGGSYDRGTGVGTSNYSGTVRFTGHAGLLDVAISNPVVRIDSATQGTLLVSVNGGASTPFATLDLAAATRSTPEGTVTYSGVPAALTSQGASVFTLNGSSFYATGTALDPVSFVIGAPAVVSNTIGATVASFTAPKKAAPTPPATTGISFVRGDAAALVAGDEITVTASGFRPNETGILVVIYSTPTVLDTKAKADASGVVTWTGRLPSGLSGAHTLTFQGSVDRGVELNIAPAAVSEAVAGCVVDDATITWGFKESFRAYISGSIANGEWTVADGATYAVPNFGWSAGTGGYDAETGEGLLAFAGSIAFTGHAGVLNTTVANPQLRFVDANTALLLLDILGTTQDGVAVDNKAVEFAKLDLSGVLENERGAVSITAAPATLTEAGAAAFGTYPAGEELDPVTVAFSTAADCALPAEEEAAPAVTSTADEAVSTEKPVDYGWVLWVVLALVVIAAAVVVTVVLRRRRA
jgi:hypothetical protein